VTTHTIRLLCLHGYHGSGDGLRGQLAPLVRGLDVPVELVCVDAPSLADGDFGWWHLNFRGWERTRDWAVELFQREPHFDGVFGFSQGAALTALLVGLRAPDGRVSERRPLSFEFAVLASGFRSDSPMHAELFATKDSFTLPSLHMMSQPDPTVATADSRTLAAQFESPSCSNIPVATPSPARRRQERHSRISSYRWRCSRPRWPGGACPSGSPWR
jgi:hypothetical protein